MQTAVASRRAVVLARLDLNAVGVAYTEPATRDFGHLVPATLDLVLVVDNVALRLHVVAAFDID